MDLKFHLLIFTSCFLLEEFALSQFIFSECVQDTPQKCDKDSLSLKWPKTNTRFLLYTRKNQKEPERLHMCNGSLPKESRFNPNNRLIIIIPGFMSGTCEEKSSPFHEIKDELLEKEDMNVIVMITSEELGNEFFVAMENTAKVANITVQVLRNIQNKTGFKYENVYMIGHSLGAHVAGIVGQQIPVYRITALDPAGVTYTKGTPTWKRLDPDDADIVDVIHTNGGTNIPYLGAYFPIGDADFYVNGGANQPGCADIVWNSIKSFDFSNAMTMSSLPHVCSHTKSMEYYKMSINNSQKKLIAYACDSYKKFKSGNCTGDRTSSVIMGFGFEESFTPEHMENKFPRKYYIDIENS